MDTYYDRLLCQTYPGLYPCRQGRDRDLKLTWGFACSNGWYPLIDSLSGLITRRCVNVQAEQVKEKFGSLRFYYSGGDDYCWGVVSMAAVLSRHICEICGAPGEIVRGGWHCCRCPVHVIPSNADELVPPQRQSPHLPQAKAPSRAGVNGLGDGWAALVTRLESALQADREHNHMPQVKLSIKTAQGHLAIDLTGGNDSARGMVALVNDYATQVDARSGRLSQAIHKEGSKS